MREIKMASTVMYNIEKHKTDDCGIDRGWRSEKVKKTGNTDN